MFKYGRMQKKIPPWLVCGSHGACLVNMLPGVQVTDFFSVFSSFSYVISSEDSDSPAVYGDLFPSSGVPSGIVKLITIGMCINECIASLAT